MKKSSLLAASVAAASATAISASSSTTTPMCNSDEGNSNLHPSIQETGSSEDKKRSTSGAKFAPRFDGLRFIETLVTAHR